MSRTNGRKGGRTALIAQVGVIGLAILLALVPLPARMVERFYSAGAFPLLQTGTTAVSNRVPFALFDAMVLVAVIGWVALLARDVLAARRQWRGAAGRLILRSATLAAVLYVVFLVQWGLNYRRLPIVQRFAVEPGGATTERADQLAMLAVDQLNALYDQAHAGDPGTISLDGSLAGAFERVQSYIAIARPAIPARPKTTLFDPYFRSAGVAGMTDPYFLETFVASDLLPIERPFVIAHEWGHLAGFADEGEANFLGWVTCVQGAEAERYSGWLFLYSEVAAGLPRPLRERASRRLGPGPRSDLQAIAERSRRNVRPRVARAGWQVYDGYLKANRVQAGTASYREVVRLILNVRFDEAWLPVLK